MKKGISAILAGSMAMSMFASLASAADTTMTTQQRYEMLEEAGIFTGFEDGTARLNERMTRAQFARVAALLLDLDLTAPPATATFRDVPKGHWAFEEVEAAVDAGIISGVGNGLFNPNANVTIQEMARVLVDALGIETDADAEVEGTVAAWAVPYVAAAVEAGLLPETTNYTAPATRAQLVDASYVALEAISGPEVVSVTANENGTITVVFNEAVDAATAADFAVTQSIGGAAATNVTPTNVTLSADMKTATLTVPTVTPTNADQSVVLNVAFGGTAAVAAPAFTVAGTLRVSTVTVPNLTQVVVTFNRDLDASSVTAANVTLTGINGAVTPAGHTYAVSGRTVTISLPAGALLSNNGFYRLDVTNVRDAQGNTITPFTTTVQATDATPPTVASVSSTTRETTTRTFTVNFSEPVYFDLARVGDVVVSTATPQGSMSYTFTVPAAAAALEAGKAYTITINGVRDLALNYAANALTANLTIARDEVRPTFTLAPVSPTQFDIVFNEAMANTVPVDAVVVKDAAGNVVPQAGLPALQGDGKTFRVTLAGTGPITGANTSATLSVTVQGLTDAVGNATATTTSTVTVAKESVKPTISSVRLLPGTTNQIEVTFSERVNGLGAGDLLVSNAGGAALAIDSISALDANNRAVITLNGAGITATGTYNVALVVNSVTDPSGNTNDAKVLTLSYTGAAAPQAMATIVTTGVTSANRVVTIQFGQANNGDADVVQGIDPATGNFRAGAADNPANYTLNGSPLPAGTVITVNQDAGPNASDTVTLNFAGVAAGSLPAALVNGGNVVITASNVRTAAGSTIQFASAQVAVADVTRPTVSQAYLTRTGTGAASDYTLTVQFSEQIEAIAAGEFRLVGSGGTPLNVTPDAAVLAGNGLSATLTFAAGNDTAILNALAANQTVTVQTINPTVTQDVADNDLQATTGAGVAVTNYAAQ